MRIRWTEPAARDLTGICDYIEEHDGPEVARKVAVRIHEGIESLLHFRILADRDGRQTPASWSFPAFLFWRCTAYVRMPSKSIVSFTARRSGLD